MYKYSLLGPGNVTCMYMFSELTIWHWASNWHLLPGADHFSYCELPMVLYLWLKPCDASSAFFGGGGSVLKFSEIFINFPEGNLKIAG